KFFPEVLDDREALPHLHIAIRQARHLPARGNLPDALLGVRLIKRDHRLLEWNVERAHHHPRPKRPGRVKFVCDEEVHGAALCAMPPAACGYDISLPVAAS